MAISAIADAYNKLFQHKQGVATKFQQIKSQIAASDPWQQLRQKVDQTLPQIKQQVSQAPQQVRSFLQTYPSPADYIVSKSQPLQQVASFGKSALNTAKQGLQGVNQQFNRELQDFQFQKQQLGQPVAFGNLETPLSSFLRTNPIGQQISNLGINLYDPRGFLSGKSLSQYTQQPVAKIKPASLFKTPQDVVDVQQKLNARTPLTPQEKKLAQEANFSSIMGLALDTGGLKNVRLKHIIGYGDDLIKRGFKVKEIDKIGFSEAKTVLDRGVTADQWRQLVAKGFKPTEPADVAKKVNILDYLRTPEPVLRKLGMDKEMATLRRGYETYQKELPQEINRVTEWYKQVPHPASSQRIFQWLDGDKIKLDADELRIADEIKSYLAGWADKLGLPKHSRVSDYITHIFERGTIEKEFDEDLAKIIDNAVPKTTYNPFLQKRMDMPGYKQDVWAALDAYVKRATRKVNMDPALEVINKASKKLDLVSLQYIKRYTAGINLRPTEIDNLVDNWIKSSPIGYNLGQRPIANVTPKVRQAVYRGTLGLNIGSATRNLTQGINTYSKLGEKYTLLGYAKAFKNLAAGDDELVRVGVLADDFIEDRSLSVSKKFWEKLDKGLFYFFDTAEKINRGAAYYGAKAKALTGGATEEKAIEFAKALIRDTQFSYAKIDTPVALQSDLVKTLFQFTTYPIKQSEFMLGLIKKHKLSEMIRFVGATAVVWAGVGKALGMDVSSFIPFSSVLTGESKLGNPPIVQGVKGVAVAALKAPNEFGVVPEGNLAQRIAGNKDVQSALTAFIPGGVQGKKTIEGLQTLNRGYTQTPAGRFRFNAPEGAIDKLKTITLGQWSTPEARAYLQSKLGVPQSKEEKMAAEFEKQERVFSAKEKAQVERLVVFVKKSKTADEKRALLQDLDLEQVKAVEKQLKSEEFKKNDTKFSSAVRRVSTNEGKARFIKLYFGKQAKTPEERKLLLLELDNAGLLTDDLLKKLSN